MRSFRTIYRRELAAAFQNPGVYAVAGMFYLLVSNLVVAAILEYARQSADPDRYGGIADLDYTLTLVGSTFGGVSILFIFVVPIVTMRAFAEERRSGMSELLATWPIRDWELILGKFLSLVTVLWLLECLMGAYVVVYFVFGDPDVGVIVSAAVGLALITTAYVAFGLFASSLTENQIVAAIVTFVGLFLFWIAHSLSGDSITMFTHVCDAASVSLHFEAFVRGDVAPIDVVYFVAFTGFWLFMTARSLEIRAGRT